jgi:hypothetical protein
MTEFIIAERPGIIQHSPGGIPAGLQSTFDASFGAKVPYIEHS